LQKILTYTRIRSKKQSAGSILRIFILMAEIGRPAFGNFTDAYPIPCNLLDLLGAANGQILGYGKII